MKPIQQFSVEVPNSHSFAMCTLLLLLFTHLKSNCLNAPEIAVEATDPSVPQKAQSINNSEEDHCLHHSGWQKVKKTLTQDALEGIGLP